MSAINNTCYSDLNQNSIKFNQIKGLKIVFYNVRSLVQHSDEVKCLINDNNIDILCCVETWLTNKHFDNEYNLSNYDILRCDRFGRRGGGVALYIRQSNKITYQLIESQINNNYQIIHIRIKQFETNYFDVISVYRPPDTRQESDERFIEFLETLESEDVIIGGDFNKDFYNSKDSEWFRNLTDIGFKQQIRSATRITDRSNTCIDHIYVKNTEKYNNFGIILTEISDHLPIFISRKSIHNKSFENKIIKYNDWKRFDRKGFDISIKYLMDDIKKTKNIDKCVEKFNTKVIQLCDKFVPKKEIMIKNRSIPYITRDLRRLMCERNEVKNRFNKFKRKNIIKHELFEKYKNLRNRINIELKKNKKEWFEKEINKTKNNSRKLWRTISNVIPSKKSEKFQKNKLDFNVNEMNDHFIQTPESIVNSFGETFHFEDMTPLCNECFSLPKVEEKDVKEIINNFDETKAVGIDGISAKHLKRLIILVPIITYLINKCLIDLKVPDLWKTAKVKALHKNGRKDVLANYRPISILSTISKIMEKIIYQNLYSFLIENKLLSKSQFGFRGGHSCTDALLSMTNEIFLQKNKGKKVCVLTLDITKAFDTVCHQILIYKLFRIGFDWKSILWFTSYLCKRKQFVKEGNNISNTRELSVAVPQGSLLGPLLFSIYINQLADIELYGQIVFYADDCSIVYSADNYNELEIMIEKSLKNINEWMNKNRLKINIEKSNYMLIDFSGRLSKDLSLKIGNCLLKRVSETKVLGIIIDNRLSFKSHIDFVCKKLSSRIGLLSRLKQFLPQNTLNLIFKSILQPLIDYGITVYGFTFDTHIKRIQRLQNRAARVISSSNDDISLLFQNLKWNSFLKRRNYFCSIFIYKCLNKLSPELCNSFFHYKKSEIRTKSVLNSELFLPKKYSETFGKSIFYSGIILYNSLAKDIRLIPDFKKFVKLLRKL